MLSALNLGLSLNALKHRAEAKSLVRKALPAARRTLGRDHEWTLKLESALSEAFYRDDSASTSELRHSVSMCEDGYERARRVYGDAHPLTEELADALDEAREELARRTQS